MLYVKYRGWNQVAWGHCANATPPPPLHSQQSSGSGWASQWTFSSLILRAWRQRWQWRGKQTKNKQVNKHIMNFRSHIHNISLSFVRPIRISISIATAHSQLMTRFAHPGWRERGKLNGRRCQGRFLLAWSCRAEGCCGRHQPANYRWFRLKLVNFWVRGFHFFSVGKWRWSSLKQHLLKQHLLRRIQGISRWLSKHFLAKLSQIPTNSSLLLAIPLDHFFQL